MIKDDLDTARKMIRAWVEETHSDYLTKWKREGNQDLLNDFSQFVDSETGTLKQWNAFCKNKYTPEMDKEVERLWRRKNSKLARALR